MESNSIANIVLKVNGDAAQKTIDNLTRRLDMAARAKDELDKKYSQGGDWTRKDVQAYSRLQKEIRKTRQELDDTQDSARRVQATMDNLSGAGPKELTRTLKTLQNAQRNVTRGSEEWNRLTAAIRDTRAELKKIDNEAKEARSLSDRVLDWGNKWMGFTLTVTEGVAALSGLKTTVQESVEAFAEMEEHMSQVRKYTGMTTEEVQLLNEDLKKMDTRTSRQALNDLAGDAGRLGISARKDVLDFVDAANQINVALGEDLGEDAVKNIGKLAQLFGDADAMGLKTAMLSVGSVINDLAQTSSADEGYLMDFTARLAGVGHQAGMTLAQVMAFGSVLDQSMVNVEKGATALQNIISAMYQKPAELARLAGMDVQKFSELLKRDGNQALLSFIDALSRAGKMDALAPMLEEMQLSGAGVTQVLTSLAANFDLVRQTQDQATEAFRNGKSVTDEYNVANNTVQAQLEKNRKKFQELTVELGERLAPATGHLMSLTGAFLSTLNTTIRFVGEHTGAIIKLTAAISAYYLATQAMNLVSKESIIIAKAKMVIDKAQLVLTRASVAATALYSAAIYALQGNLARAAVAMRTFTMAIAANPIGLLAAGIAVAITSLVMWKKRAEEAAEAAEEFRRKNDAVHAANEQAAESTTEEIGKIRTLQEVLRNSAYSYETKRKALAQLQAMVPDYHATLTEEGRLVGENTEAIDIYIQALQRKARAEAYYNKMVELEGKLATAKTTTAQKSYNVEAVNAELNRNANRYSQPAATATGTGIIYTPVNREREKKLEELATQQAAYNASLHEEERLTQQLAALQKAVGSDPDIRKYYEAKVLAAEKAGKVNTFETIATGNGGGNGGATGQGNAQAVQEAVDRIRKGAEEQRGILLQSYAQGEIDYLEYQQRLRKIDEESASQQIVAAQANAAVLQKTLAQAEKERQQWARNQRDYSLAQLEKDYEEEQGLLRQKHIRENTDTRKAQQELDLLQTQYLQRRLELLRESTSGASAEDIHRAEQELQAASDAARLRQEESYLQELQAMRNKYAKLSAEEQQRAELQTLEDLHAKKLVSEEEYLRLRKSIEAGSSGTSTGTSTALQMASKGVTAPKGTSGSGDLGIGALATAAITLQNDRQIFQNLQQLRDQDLISQEEYNEASMELDAQRYEHLRSVAAAAFSSVGALMGSVSSLMQANMSIEEAAINRRYDAEIEAAGENSRKGKQLEEKRQAEIAKVRNKYNKRMMAVEIAQAIAQTAVNALGAYGAMVEIPVVGPALAIAAAAAATAAGMIQVAVIKKQHEAQAQGYYSGGYTGNGDPRQEAGIVHRGEFVVNNRAVNNPNIRPLLDVIDAAQRNNTVATLTREDVTGRITTREQLLATPVIIQRGEDNSEVVRKLSETLDKGIQAFVVMDGPLGLDAQQKKYQSLKNRGA